MRLLKISQMKTIHKTYRFAAAITLILFASNILVPVVVSATSLHCDMEMAKNKHSHHACCVNTGNENHHRETENTDESCPTLSFCANSIDESQSDQPALLQASKIVIAADFIEELTFLVADSDHPKKFNNDPVSAGYSPPIFLLNSVFLN